MTSPNKLVFSRYDYATFTSYFAYAACGGILPIALLALSKELGFDMDSGDYTAGGALALGATIPLIVSMLLCGFIAGRYGLRKTFGCAVLSLLVGASLCTIAPTYSLLFVALAIGGLGQGVVEGLATPFISNIHTGDSGRYVNLAHSFWAIGVVCTVLISGYLLSIGLSWRYLMLGAGLLTIIPTLMLLAPEGKGHEYPEHPEPKTIKTIFSDIKTILRMKRFWLFYLVMFIAGGGESTLSYWCASYIQLHYKSSAWSGGLGTAIFAGGMIIGRLFFGIKVKQAHLRTMIICSAIVAIIATLCFQLVESLTSFYIILIFAGASSAPFWPSIQSLAVDRMPKQDATMMFVLLSCAGIPGGGFLIWLFGYIGTISGSLMTALYLIPICFSSLIVFLWYDYFKYERDAN